MSKPPRYLVEIRTHNLMIDGFGLLQPLLAPLEIGEDPLYIWSEPGTRPVFGNDDRIKGHEPCTFWNIAFRGQLLYNFHGEKQPDVFIWNPERTKLFNPAFLPELIVWRSPTPATTTEAAASAPAQQGQDPA